MKLINRSTLIKFLFMLLIISTIYSCKKNDNPVNSNNSQVIDTILKWKYNTGKKVYYSSPAIGSDGTIYIGNGIIGDNGTSLVALNPDGSKKWQIPMSEPVFTPLIASDGMIYVQDASSTLYSINPDGTEKWKFILNIRSDVGQSSPAIDFDGTVYICADGVYAIKPNGSLKWHYNDPYYPVLCVRSSPSLNSSSCIFVAVNASIPNPCSLWKLSANGNLLWKCNFNEADFVFSSPAIATDGTIYVGAETSTGGNLNFIYAVNPDSTLKWKYTITDGRTVRSSPAIDADGTIYIGTKASYSSNAVLLALNPDRNLKWSYPIQTPNADIYCSPTIGSDGIIYFGAENCLLHALNPDGTLNWAYDTKNGINWTSPAIANDGTIYIGNNSGNLFAIKSKSTGLKNSQWPKFRFNNQNIGRTN